MKHKYVTAFMDMTCRFAQTSEAERLKVGAMLCKDGNPIAFGVNGTRSGWYTNKCEDEHGNTTSAVRHAEIAALDKLRRSTETSVGATLFVSHCPCLSCSVEIVEAGIEKVFYKFDYRNADGLKYLREHGIPVIKLEDS